MIKFLSYGFALMMAICPGQNVFAQQREEREKSLSGFKTDIPAQLYNIILARPSDKSITISILANENLEGLVEYGLQKDKLSNKTPLISFAVGTTNFIELNNLQADKNYFYRVVFKRAGKQETSPIYSFRTQRRPGNGFTFAIQADSHLDENTDTAMYTQTLRNMASDGADFLVDLGDTWMDDKHEPDFKSSLSQYIAQRYYFGLVGKSSPVFFTLGNHDGEAGQPPRRNQTENMLKWATATRKAYYANPEPNSFYTGNAEKENELGNPGNYYAWQWGDALFVIMDAFRYSSGNRNPWQRSLGQVQYDWLKSTLQHSKAKFKFLFIHNLVGGVDLKGRGRGGAEAANYFEWGGKDTSDVNQFATQRPGWEMPIHDLMKQYKVDILFHGHDHFFAKQEKDGVVYQLVPQPGIERYGNTNMAAEYGYFSGVIKNNPGYLRVSVSGNKATVDYVQTSITERYKNKEIIYSYEISRKGN